MSREVVSRHFNALGSTCELLTLDTGQAALERCEQRVRDAEARFTRFVLDSELAQLNGGDGRYVPVSPEMYAMLEAALWAFEESGGLVNAAVLPAPAQLSPRQVPALPSVLILDAATRSAALAAGATLDLGGIVKGALADVLIDELGDEAVCNLGGDVRIRGLGPEGDGWHIGLCDRSAVALTEGAVCTSGTTKPRRGQGMHHLIDPRTGMPVKTDLTEVSVVTDVALRGEVYAMCAMLLGADAGIAFLEARGIHHAVVGDVSYVAAAAV